ncbi:MAG TPA: 3-hydroxyacyl-CoA dehydrogenase NAD-binding domain-containing protein, partial [Protaetiibacter sp.]|nr:3-hydroxyacyl-CoA dehydrogenase NAD-binding domain-containing protein [Protaetiibacter sp.]
MTSMTTPPRITVVGTGYLGATHAVCMAMLGVEVLGVDVDERKIAELAAGRVPFYEPGLAEELSSALASGRLRFTTDF